MSFWRRSCDLKVRATNKTRLSSLTELNADRLSRRGIQSSGDLPVRTRSIGHALHRRPAPYPPRRSLPAQVASGNENANPAFALHGTGKDLVRHGSNKINCINEEQDKRKEERRRRNEIQQQKTENVQANQTSVQIMGNAGPSCDAETH